MIKCVTCYQEISKDTRTCPKCGAKQFKKITPTVVMLSLIISFLIALLFSILFSVVLGNGANSIFDFTFFTMMLLAFSVTLYQDFYKRKKIRKRDRRTEPETGLIEKGLKRNKDRREEAA